MSVFSLDLQDVDILSDSLSLMGDHSSVQDDGLVRYGDLVLNIAAKASIYSLFSVLCYLIPALAFSPVPYNVVFLLKTTLRLQGLLRKARYVRVRISHFFREEKIQKSG